MVRAGSLPSSGVGPCDEPFSYAFFSLVFKRLVVFPVDGISRSSISCLKKIGTEGGNETVLPMSCGFFCPVVVTG